MLRSSALFRTVIAYVGLAFRLVPRPFVGRRQVRVLKRTVHGARVRHEFDFCMWGTWDSRRCGREARLIVITSSTVGVRHVVWAPSCIEHAAVLAQWAETRVTGVGRSVAADVDDDEALLESALMADLLSPPPPADFGGQRGHGEGTSREPRRSLKQGRLIGHAMPIPAGVAPGIGAEIATHDAAATWGLPDFVCPAIKIRKGSGWREVGDGLLVTGEVVAVVQVKRRDAPTGNPERECKWIAKKVAQSIKQFDGSARMLRTHQLRATTARGTDMDLEVGSRKIMGIVVLDHDDVPDETIALTGRDDVLVLTRRDWELVFGRLRSIHAALAYFELVSGLPEVPLGSEVYRILALEELDGDIDPAWRRLFSDGERIDFNPFSSPQTDAEYQANMVVRIIQEDLANAQGPVADRLEVLALLDALPAPARTLLGQNFLAALAEAERKKRRGHPYGTGRVRVGGAFPQIVWAVVPAADTETLGVLELFMAWQHHQFAHRAETFVPWTVQIVLVPDEFRWGTLVTWTQGDPEIDPAEIEQLRALFGPEWDDDRVDDLGRSHGDAP